MYLCGLYVAAEARTERLRLQQKEREDKQCEVKFCTKVRSKVHFVSSLRKLKTDKRLSELGSIVSLVTRVRTL